jgi:hypothetical protein
MRSGQEGLIPNWPHLPLFKWSISLACVVG